MVHHHEPECHAKKMGFYLQGQGHIVGLYNQNKTVSTISFTSEPFATKLNLNVDHHKQRSVQWKCWIAVWSLSQPRLKVSVNVSLDDILCIAEPFVTKPSMVRHHYKPERHMWKMGFCLPGQGHSNWISVHTIKYNYFYYMFYTAYWGGGGGGGGTNLVWQCISISWNVLWKCCFAVFKVKVTVKVLNFSDLYLWSVKLSMVMHHHQPVIQKYFAMFKIKATIVSTRSSEILKLLQSKLVWWYMITRQSKKDHEKKFLLLHRAWDREYGLGDSGLDCCHSWLSRYLKQGSNPVPIKKMWRKKMLL